MLINRVSEVNDNSTVKEDRVDHHTREYQTASELFDIMAKDHELNVADVLTASDLVLLYKNLDAGVNFLSNSNKVTKRSNQHVETIVYEDDLDSEESDISEIYNTDDVNVYTFNKERLDILNSRPSLGNSLCQKLGGIEIESSNLNNAYHQNFNVFQDSCIKDQLNYNFGFEDFEDTVLPATLLDYICCKRLEDNYNFYMDNIIRYVKHTIEQLKRISNGDYLTDKAKEKWREVTDPVDQSNNTKILATSTSIPLHIERKTSKHVPAWDDIVHSEVDIRSLSKILEKKIIVEVPKLICGTYKLFSRRYADNLIISCKRENNPTIEEEKEGDSRVDVVLQLEKSQSGQVVSNISSIMILKTQQEINVCDPLPLPYKDVEDYFFDANDNNFVNKLQIVELDNENENCDNLVPRTKQDNQEIEQESFNDTNEYSFTDNEDILSPNHSFFKSKESNEALKNVVVKKFKPQPKFSYEVVSPDKLRLTMQRFNSTPSLVEESVDDESTNSISKKKSPTRIRLKSPYENQSHTLEEKKRRRLLEIREKREKKKLALGEHCKVSKHKYTRGGIMPQASSSVTKLSITNKSFYNSIYGQTNVSDQYKAKNRKGSKNDSIPEVPLDHEGEYEITVVTPENKKYINRSYYLDDTVSEMMYMQMKQSENSDIKACSASTSVVSSDFRANLTLLSQLIGPSVIDLNVKCNRASSEEQTLSSHKMSIVDNKEKEDKKDTITSQSTINVAPANTPKNKFKGDISDPEKVSSSVECRKSIDKIYDLMKKLEKGEGDEGNLTKTIFTSGMDRVNLIERRVSSTIQGSDSGTSLKHHLTSSNPSCFSFEKPHTEFPKLKPVHKKSEIPVVPKVIISNKVITQKVEVDKIKKPKRSIMSPSLKTQDNPLKAISQLLHEFDNVQKCRQKTGDSKANKKHEVTSNDVKSTSYQRSSKVRSRLELQLKETEVLDRSPKVTSPRKLKTSLGIIRNARQQILTDDHDNITKRKIIDIIDEAKEARGEAVKGPSKLNSRLNSLAQPKKSYVQARIEEHPSRSVRTLADRHHKLATAPPIFERKVGSPNYKITAKKTGTEAVSSVSVKQPPVQPLAEAMRMRRSANSSPEDKPMSPVSSSKRNNVPPTPETLNKMVAVESYVKNHYRRAAPMSPLRDRHPGAGHKSRIPLLPNDIELGSITSANTAEESTEVGSKLHHMISTVLDITPGLTVLSEDLEITCNQDGNLSITDDLCRVDERASIDSDYPVDVFEDKHIVTAVEDVPKKTTVDKIIEEDSNVFKSAIEIQKLENALCRKWPTGAFQKRLRIKNLTLPPKHSMKQVFVLQSGDVGSLVIKSSHSKTVNLDFNNKIEDLKELPVLSKTELDWNFTNFPMQIATVGYAFPQCQSPFDLNSKINIVDDVSKTVTSLNKTVEHSKDIDQTIPITEEMPEDDNNNINESSILSLNVKLEEGKIDLIHSFVDAVAKSQKKDDPATSETPDSENKPIQKSDFKNINYTTSLDMLVGLLNEIQKITSCQTHITNNDADDQQCKELETILDDAAALDDLSKDSPRGLVSIASLGKLRKLESNPSIYTLYLSSDDENDKMSLANLTKQTCKPTKNIDKEINVDIGTRECINRFTDVPSIFPININHSTNVTNSLIGVLSRPSSHSLFSFMEYQTLYSDSSFNTYKKIIQLPQQIDEKKENASKHFVAVCKEKVKLNEKVDLDSFELSLPCKKTSKKANQRLTRGKRITKRESHAPDLDPMLKMKRDILVTVYSILVITVFAALSFPEVLYQV